METVQNIEDILQLVSGLKQTNLKFVLNPNDTRIIHSIARQTFKEVALTDRQYELMKTKMLEIRDQFIDQNIYNFDAAIETLKYGLRSINREQSIKLVNTEEVYKNSPYESYKDKWVWLKIRFPFSKKLIVTLENCRIPFQEKHHERSTQVHYIKASETNIFKIVDAFKNKNFDIDDEILSLYKEINTIIDKGLKEYIPYYENGQVNNISEKSGLQNKTITELQAYDRRFYHAYYVPEKDASEGHLIEKIAYRKTLDLLIDPKQHTFDELVKAVLDLDRFPMLVILDDAYCLEQLTKIHKSLKYIFKDEEQTVLFRVDSKSDQADVNSYIGNNNLNNWLDKNTKVVYIIKSKLPKLLVKTEWKPQIIYAPSSTRFNTTLANFCENICDLTILHDSRKSYFSTRKTYF